MSTRSAIKSMMYQNALNSLYNGAVMPHEREILARAPLPTDIVDPFVSQDVDPRQIMGFAYNSLVTWIDQAKKANYFSKKFIELSRLVMKGVMTMGRGLVALHNRGEDLAQAPMQIGDLISVSSYHFRKSYLGVIQTAQSHPEISERLLINQLSWTNMLFRLYKTKDKLEKPLKVVSGQRSVAGLNSEALGNPGCASDQGKPKLSDPFSDNDQGNPMFPAVSGRPLPDIAAIFEPGAFSAPRALSALDESKQCGIRNAKLDYENSEARKAKTEKIASVMDSKNIIRNSKSISSEKSSKEEANEVCGDPQAGHRDVCSLTRERVSCVRPANTTPAEESQAELSLTDTTAPKEESQTEISFPDDTTPAGEEKPEISFSDNTAPAGKEQAEISPPDNTSPESELPEEDRSPEIMPNLRADNPPPLAVRNPLREVQASPDSDAERELRPRARRDAVSGQEQPPENPKPDFHQEEYIHATDQSTEISDPVPIPDPVPEEQIHTYDPPIDPPDRLTADPNIPFYLEILRHAFDRSSPNEEGAITFTEEEIIYLASDPDFAAIYPDQAAQMRKILQGDG